MRSANIIHLDLFHQSKGDFCKSCAVRSFEKHCIVVNLIVPVHLAEDFWAIYL